MSENGEGGEGEEQQEPKNILTKEQIQEGLSMIAKTHGKSPFYPLDDISNIHFVIDGSTYAYVTLNVEEKEVEELGEHLRNYRNLRYLNFSKNSLKDVSEIVHIPYLLTLDINTN